MVFECFVPEDGLWGCCFRGVPGGSFGRFLWPWNTIINNYLPKRSYATTPPPTPEPTKQPNNETPHNQTEPQKQPGDHAPPPPRPHTPPPHSLYWPNTPPKTQPQAFSNSPHRPLGLSNGIPWGRRRILRGIPLGDSLGDTLGDLLGNPQGESTRDFNQRGSSNQLYTTIERTQATRWKPP
jgi:hypothetical protein